MYCSTFRVRKVKKSQRYHKCTWCGEAIPAGSNAVSTAGVFDGDFFHSYFHPECNDASYRLKGDDDDGWYPHEFKRGSTELRGT